MKRLILVAALAIAGTASAADKLLLNGAGATFPFPLYSKWFTEYNKLHPEYQFNYQSIGSGGGIQQITDRTVDFGASDAPMKDDAAGKPRPGNCSTSRRRSARWWSPTTCPASTAASSSTPTRSPTSTSARSPSGTTPRLAALNPGVKLPDTAIIVVHRSDGSRHHQHLHRLPVQGLGRVEVPGGRVDQRQVAGRPRRQGQRGGHRAGEADPGRHRLRGAGLRQAEQAPHGAAAEQGRRLGEAHHGGRPRWPPRASTCPTTSGSPSPTPPGKDAYPMASFTYLLVPQDQQDPVRARALVEFIWWAVHDGQKLRHAARLRAAPRGRGQEGGGEAEDPDRQGPAHPARQAK